MCDLNLFVPVFLDVPTLFPFLFPPFRAGFPLYSNKSFKMFPMFPFFSYIYMGVLKIYVFLWEQREQREHEKKPRQRGAAVIGGVNAYFLTLAKKNSSRSGVLMTVTGLIWLSTLPCATRLALYASYVPGSNS